MLRKKTQQGFTLLEVLVAVIVLAIGLLGLAALQLTSLGYNRSAYLRGQAVAQAYDIMDRMRANKPNAEAGDYNRALGASPPADTTTIANQDLTQWLASLSAALPSGDGAIECAPIPTPVDCENGVVVTVQWDDQHAGRGSGNTTEQIQIGSRL